MNYPPHFSSTKQTLDPQLVMAGRSGYLKISGWVFRVLEISGFQKYYLPTNNEDRSPLEALHLREIFDQ